jgi:porin
MQQLKVFTLAFLSFLPSTVQALNALTPAFSLTLEHVRNLEGGVDQGSRSLASADFTLTADTAEAGLWQGGEFFGYVLANYGGDPSELVGDVQGMSNIAAEDETKLYELWYQHSFLNGQLKTLLGLHDYNAVFYSLDSAALFTHPSFGIGPDTSQVGPSIFPTTAVAALLSVEVENYYAHLAIYDGVPGHPDGRRGTYIRFEQGEGVFRAGELGIKTETYKVGVGAWQHNALVENPVNAQMHRDNQGLYLIAEYQWFEHFALFLQAGFADEEVNQLESYYGLGGVYTDLWLSGDALGLAAAQAKNSDSFLKHNLITEQKETTWELSYALPVSDQVTLQSSAFYVINPSMDSELDNAFALGFRLVFSLE